MDTEKRKLSKSQYKFLSLELKYLGDKQIITKEQVQNSLDMYVSHSSYNFTRVILTIASLLVGLGILTFIASNWKNYSESFKFCLIIFLLAVSAFSSLKTEQSYPKTSRALLYFTAIIFGGGIFLIQQIFNLTFRSSTELFIWGLTILPLALVYKDIVILVLSQILVFSFLVTYDIPIFYLLLLFALYIALYHKLYILHDNRLLPSLAFIISVSGFLIKILIVLNTNIHWIFASFFVLGLVMISIKHLNLYYVFLINSVGVLLVLVSGIFLTISSVYYDSSFDSEKIAMWFAIAYILLLLYWLKKGNIYSIPLICSVILRYYFDLSLEFMSKSFVFIIAGLILGIFGFWFEMKRREGATKNEP